MYSLSCIVALLSILSLSSVKSQMQPGPNPSQPSPRYSPLSQCLNSTSLDCVSCSVRVSVDTALGRDCRRQENLANSVCNSLLEVLESVADMNTRHQDGGCIEISILPAIGADGQVGTHYLDVGEMGIEIEQNVILRGVQENQGNGTSYGVPVSFPARNVIAVSSEAFYVLRFCDSFLVGISDVSFVDGYGIIGFDDVRVVAIENSGFRSFLRGAVDMFNCPTVFVRNSFFANNGPVAVTKSAPYRGHAAGLSVAIDLPPDHPGPLVQITRCTFLNNSAETRVVSNETFFTNFTTTNITNNNNNNNDNDNNDNNNNNNNNNNGRNRNGSRDGRGDGRSESDRFDVRGGVVQALSFPGRGGGLAVIINAMRPAQVTVNGCTFETNDAFEFGGGMYSYLEGTSAHTVNVIRCRFYQNFSPTGGGLHMSFAEEAQLGSLNQVIVRGTEFIQNSATYGGGAYFLSYVFNASTTRDNNVAVFCRFRNCTFHQNDAQEVGGAIGIASTIVVSGSENTRPLEIVGSTFTENNVNGAGIVSVAKFPAAFLGRNVFSGNRGPCLAVIATLVRVSGSLVFRNNTNVRSLDGGAVYVTSLGQLLVDPQTTVRFDRNEGSNGAALVVQRPSIPSTFSQLLFNPLCPLLFSDPTVLPDSWADHNVSMIFSNNKAIVASAVYANEIDICSWTSLSPPFFDRKRVFRWNFTSFSNNLNKAHNNERDSRWDVQTPPVRLAVQQNMLEGFPGERMMLRVFAYDELNETTSATIRITDEAFNAGLGNTITPLFQFTPSSLTLDRVTNGARFELSFKRRMGASPQRSEVINVETLTSKPISMDTFTLNSRRCPPGTKLLGASTFLDCVCDTGREDVLMCDGSEITLADHLWGTVYNAPPDQNEDPLSSFTCPPEYCSCTLQNTSGTLQCNFVFDSRSLNSQCHCDRQGVLCGNCREGLGFSTLLNKCVSCDEGHGAIILVLFAVDLIIMTTLLVAMVPVPLWLYPVLFHLQLLPYFTNYFPVTFEKVRPFMFYVASALGLYFPYDFCLNSGMSALVAYTIRYMPLLTAVILTPIVVAIRYKMCRPCVWHGVWWLVLLLYTSVLHTSMSILDCPIFRTSDGSNVPRWYVNGNIRCFNNEHIPLGLLAIIILGLCVSLVPLFILLSLDKLKRPRWLHYLAMALTEAYKDKYKWWSGVELAKRIALVLFAVAFKKNEYPVIFVLMILLGVLGFMKPYKSRAVNILDMVLASNILILLLLRNTQLVTDELQVIPEQPSTNRTPLFLFLNSTDFNNSTDRGCLKIVGISRFAILLTPFYYLPLFTALCILIAWVSYYAYIWFKDCYNVHKSGKGLELEAGIGSPLEMNRARALTQTIVDIREYDPEQSPISQALPAGLEHRQVSKELSTGEDSLSPIASLYLKARRVSSKRKASRRSKKGGGGGGIELQSVPNGKNDEKEMSCSEVRLETALEEGDERTENGSSPSASASYTLI